MLIVLPAPLLPACCFIPVTSALCLINSIFDKLQ